MQDCRGYMVQDCRAVSRLYDAGLSRLYDAGLLWLNANKGLTELAQDRQ